MTGRELRAAAAVAAVLAVLPASALEIPAGTQIEIRLKTKVSSATARAGDAVEAIVIAPVQAGKDYGIPAGASVHGVVAQATHPSAADQRAVLSLKFNSVDVAGSPVKLQAQLVRVDNAREQVDEQGRVTGILASETITGKLDSAIEKVAERYSGLADVLSAAKGAVFNAADTDIVYDSGVEMTLKLTAPVSLKSPGGAGPLDKLRPFDDQGALRDLVQSAPFRAVAENPPKPSDLTNILLVGPREAVEDAFAAAGWATAASLSGQAKFETVRALAESRGYKEAPVSILMLNGRPPEVVFEKLNNTFAQRHHLRIWAWPKPFQNQPVWLVAATHDTGISFSEVDHTFIHRIDSEIDRERDKVANDLLLTGRVVSFQLVERPAVPRNAENATGDSLITDGKMAALLLR